MDDHALVRRMVSGDERAFDEFFAAYFQRLFRFAVRRLGDPDAAEDVVQAVLVTAVRRIGTWRGEAALFTWLCTLCRHEVYAHARRVGRRLEVQAIDDDPDVRATLEAVSIDPQDRPDDRLERRELARLVQVALDYLPDRYGDVLEWKYIQDLSVAEIAGRLGATPKAAESMLTRARNAFREAFAAHGGSWRAEVES